MRVASAFAVLALFFLAATGAEAGTIIFQDTFETGPAGTPDVGTYTLFGQASQHVILDDGSGSNNVLVSSAGLNSGGFTIQTQQQLTQSVKVEYDFRVVQSDSSLSGINAIIQQLVLDTSPNNVQLNWASDGSLYYSNGTATPGPIDTTWNWAYDTDYHVTWTADAATDIVTLGIGGLGSLTLRASDLTLPDGPFDNYKSFALSRNVVSIVTQRLDNLTITDLGAAAVPLPAAGWAGLVMLGFLGIGRLRRRTCRTSAS